MTPRDDLRAALDEETKHYGPPSKANAWTVEAIAVHRAAERVLAEPSAAEVLTRLRDWIKDAWRKLSPLNDDDHVRGVGQTVRGVTQEIDTMLNELDKPQQPEAPKPEPETATDMRAERRQSPQTDPPAEREPHDCGYVGCGAEDARRLRKERDQHSKERVFWKREHANVDDIHSKLVEEHAKVVMERDGARRTTEAALARANRLELQCDALRDALASVVMHRDYGHAVEAARKLLKEAT